MFHTPWPGYEKNFTLKSAFKIVIQFFKLKSDQTFFTLNSDSKMVIELLTLKSDQNLFTLKMTLIF
jgi:hypothetical protein